LIRCRLLLAERSVGGQWPRYSGIIVATCMNRVNNPALIMTIREDLHIYDTLYVARF